jgi:sigma-B regulation protein RsbU (phosphoserine phosphatase)
MFQTAGRELEHLAAAQRRLLPQTAPAWPNYDLCLAYRPASVVTGDYHDFILRPDGRLGVFVGDGSGHGPAASLLVVTMRALLHTHGGLHREPGDTLGVVSPLFHRLTQADQFMTGVYLLLGERGWVSWASAGHDPPLHLRPHHAVAAVDLGPVGFPLGLSAEAEYQTVCWQLRKGDRLLLFTDGLVEARRDDGQAFGRQRLRAYLSAASEMTLAEVVRGLLDQVEAHQGSGQFEDDFTIVAVERVL